jgi:cytochrome b subunit of formate dehydrogenase
MVLSGKTMHLPLLYSSLSMHDMLMIASGIMMWLCCLVNVMTLSSISLQILHHSYTLVGCLVLTSLLYIYTSRAVVICIITCHLCLLRPSSGSFQFVDIPLW